MSSKGIVVGYIHFSKLSQKSSRNQVDYTCKTYTFFFFWWGYTVGGRALLLLRSPEGSQE